MPRLRQLLLACTVVAITLGAPAHSENKSTITARYAVLVGERAIGAEPAHLSEDEAEELLSSGSAQVAVVADRLGFASVRDAQTGSVELPGRGGSLTATAGREGAQFRFELDCRVEAGSEAVTRIQVWENDEIVTAPTVRSLLGDSAIVASGSADGTDIVWLIFEIAPAS